MSDPSHRRVARHNLSSVLWGIIVVFVVVMLGLFAYGYHGVQNMQGAAGPADRTAGQSAPAPASKP